MMYKAIGYHGTNKEAANDIKNNGINVSFNTDDKFLGQGFYLWRDSLKRARRWAAKPDNTSVAVLAVEIESKHDEMLNFTSREWGNERELLDIFFRYFKKKNKSFGEFIDFLRKEENLKINVITILDLGRKPKLIPMPKEINFAYGDIQICVKDMSVVKNIYEVNYED